MFASFGRYTKKMEALRVDILLAWMVFGWCRCFFSPQALCVMLFSRITLGRRGFTAGFSSRRTDSQPLACLNGGSPTNPPVVVRTQKTKHGFWSVPILRHNHLCFEVCGLEEVSRCCRDLLKKSQ